MFSRQVLCKILRLTTINNAINWSTYWEFSVWRNSDIAYWQPHFSCWKGFRSKILLEDFSIEKERHRADVSLSFARCKLGDILVLISGRLLWWIYVKVRQDSRRPIAYYQTALPFQRLVSSFDSSVWLKRVYWYWWVNGFYLFEYLSLTPVGNSSKAITVNTTNVPLKILSGSETFPLMSRL